MKTLCESCVWANTLGEGHLSTKEAITWCASEMFVERIGESNFPEVSECKSYDNEIEYKAAKEAQKN